MNAAFPWRDAAIVGGTVTGVWVVAGCELLGLFRAVAFWPLLIWWGVPIVVLAWKCRTWRPAVPQLLKDRLLISIVGAGVLVLALIFIQAAATPPNNWDALSYHLPRQVYWMQQRHVGFFPTNDPRMLLMQPLAEYAGLHLMILSDGDRWVNLVQWFALALTALTASAIARELGCNHRLQAMAALLVVTIPVAVLEAANPKNDLVTAFFLCALAFFGLKAYRLARTFALPNDIDDASDGRASVLGSRNPSGFSALLIGAACGLLLLSKGTGMIFGFPVALWIGAACIRVMRVRRALIWGTAVALIALSINAGFLIRLTAAFGSPMGPPVGKGSPAVANTLLTPRAFVSNLARNTAMHLATGSEQIDAATTRAVTAFHDLLGLDVNDPRTTFSKTAPFAVKPNFSDEDRAKAPMHVALGMAAFAIGIASLCRRGDKWIVAFLLIPFVCFALFSYLIAWQEWHSRLHIPALCLAAPVIARALRGLVFPFGFVAFTIGLMCVITNEAKPLFHLSRARHRFKDAAVLKGLEEARRVVHERRPKVLGIVARPNKCEYFLLSTVLKAQPPPPVFVKLNSFFPQLESSQTNCDLVISWHANAEFQASYTLISEAGVVAVFGRK